MKPGDIIGITIGVINGNATKFNNWLYCEVIKRSPQSTTLWVINGHWTLILYPGGYGVVKETDHCIEGIKISFIGTIPAEFRDNYNDAILYMERFSKKNLFVRLYLSVIDKIKTRYCRFTKALRRAKIAFKSEYSTTDTNYDDIPF